MSQNLPLPIFVFSRGYDIDLGPHVFPAIKFGLLHYKLQQNKTFAQHQFVEPRPISVETAALVHKRSYLRDLVALKPSAALAKSELPLQKKVVDAFFLACGGTLTAAQQALEHGMAFNLSGGFHHAFAERAEGFCYLNDIAIAAAWLRREKKANKILIIDLDVHQGNGTAKIFSWNRSVFTFSMHDEHNYPPKEKGSLDVGLDTGTGDDEYLRLLAENLIKIKKLFQPDLIFYLAGVDPFFDDQLGGLSISKAGLGERDQMVKNFMPDIPLAITLAGGYARRDEDTIDLHMQTCRIFAGIE